MQVMQYCTGVIICYISCKLHTRSIPQKARPRLAFCGSCNCDLDKSFLSVKLSDQLPGYCTQQTECLTHHFTRLIFRDMAEAINVHLQLYTVCWATTFLFYFDDCDFITAVEYKKASIETLLITNSDIFKINSWTNSAFC